MSVIKFGQKEIDEIEGMVKFQIERNTSMKGIVIHSDIYAKKYLWERPLSKGFVDEDKLINEVIGRLFWYLWVANKTAFALQYEEEPGFFIDVIESKVSPKPCMLKELRGKIRSLNYNLFTNDGHYFVAEEWYELFDDIIEGIDSQMVYAFEERHL